MSRIATFGEKARKILSGLRFNYLKDWMTRAEALAAAGDLSAIRRFIVQG